LPMVNVLESTLESKKGEFIFNSGIGSHTPCFSLGPCICISWDTGLRLET
jgi:hypothetical protein